MINSKILKLENELINALNNSELPPAIIGLVLNKLSVQVDLLTKQAIDSENRQILEEEANNEENSDKEQK